MPDPVVVGAGPSGMTAALALRAYGMSPIVVETKPRSSPPQGSRALFVHRESMALWDLLWPGLGHEVAAAGIVWRTRSTLYRGRKVYSKSYGDRSEKEDGGLPPFTSLRQADTETFLRQACERAGVDFRWDTPVNATSVVCDDSVRVHTDNDADIPASYVIAADGARSNVRSSLGIALQGPRRNAFHVVVDIAGEPPERERTLHYRCPELDGRTVLIVPFAGGFQVDLQCRPEDDADALADRRNVLSWLSRLVPDIDDERILWSARYRFSQAVAESFTDNRGRVLLVGEAAHLFPPFGARGMNSGIADAVAAANAVALARGDSHEGSGPHSAVQAFADDRRQAALFNASAAGHAFGHLHPQSIATVLRQEVAARAARFVPRCGTWLERSAFGPTVAKSGGRY